MIIQKDPTQQLSAVESINQSKGAAMPDKKAPITKTCACGNPITVDRHRTWCEKCGQPVYYNAKDQNHHKLNTIYVGAMIVLVLGFLTYVFIELIAEPLL